MSNCGELITKKTQITVDQVEGFLTDLKHIFIEAAKLTNGDITHYYDIAGLTFKLRFAGRALIPFFTTALEHLKLLNPINIDLTICIWDAESTKTKPPNVPWNKCGKFTQATQDNDVVKLNSDYLEIIADPGAFSLCVIDKKNKIAYYWIESKDKVPWWTSGAPFLSIINSWSLHSNLLLLHAGAVGTKHGSVLLAGKGGAGKSTTVLACLQGGLQYIAEDHCLLKVDQQPNAYSLYNSTKLTENSLAKFPQYNNLRENLELQPGGKFLLFYQQLHPEKILTASPLRAILGLQISNTKDTSISKIGPATILRKLAISTIFQLKTDAAYVMQSIRKLLQKTPYYQLNVGTEVEQIPRIITKLLENK